MTKTLPLNPSRADTMHPNAQEERLMRIAIDALEHPEPGPTPYNAHLGLGGWYVDGPGHFLRGGRVEMDAKLFASDLNNAYLRGRNDGREQAASGTNSKPPYPFCLTPDECAGKGSCPRDPCCAE